MTHAERPSRKAATLALALFAMCAVAAGELAGCRGSDSAGPEPPAGIIAYVDGQGIEAQRFAQAYAREMARRKNPPTDPLSVLNAKIALLNRLVDRVLIAQEMKRLGIAVSPDELRAAVAAVKGDYPKGEFDKSLAESGETSEEWMAALAETLLHRKIAAEVIAPKIEISDAEMLDYYRAHADEFSQDLEVHAEQILVATDGRARTVHRRLTEGADFGVLAEEVSIAPERTQGGDLGWFGPGTMPQEFDEVLFELPVGELSDVVRTEYGFHIFRVVDKREAREYSFEEARDRIHARMLAARTERGFAAWVAGLRERAEIGINESLLGR